MRKKQKNFEALFWSIALPGFGQFINQKIIKGIVLLFLEFLINVKSNFNMAILYSFNGEFGKADSVLDYQWLMFYPCLYMFALWDAYRDANEIEQPYGYLPLAFGAFSVTVGLMIFRKVMIFGINFGPVFIPMFFLIPGLLIGYLLRKILLYSLEEKI